MQWWACNPQVLILYVQFELSNFAKYRYRCMGKHNAGLLQVGQNVLVRMGTKWSKIWKSKIWKGKIAKPGVTRQSRAGDHAKGKALQQYRDRLPRQCNRPTTIWQFDHPLAQGHPVSMESRVSARKPERQSKARDGFRQLGWGRPCLFLRADMTSL